MPTSNHDAARLWDMLDAALTIGFFTDGIAYDEYVHDE